MMLANVLCLVIGHKRPPVGAANLWRCERCCRFIGKLKVRR